MIIKIVLFLLKRSRLSLEDRGVLINGILDKLGALPLRDIIVFSEDGSILVNGRALDHEEIIMLRESAKSALKSRAIGLIRDQVLYKAFTYGLNSSTNFEQVYFAKAAVWWGLEEDKLLKALSSIGSGEQDLPL